MPFAVSATLCAAALFCYVGAARAQYGLCRLSDDESANIREKRLSESEALELAHASGAAIVAILHPGDQLDASFRLDQIIIQIDAAGEIVSLRCG
jgi:hypothetical protein